MTHLEQFLSMMKEARCSTFSHVQKFNKGYTPGHFEVSPDEEFTVIALDAACRGEYHFIFKSDGSLLTTEPAGY